MSKFKKRILPWLIDTVLTVVVIYIGTHFVLGQTYIDKDLIKVKKGEIVSEFTLNETISVLKYICPLGAKNIVIRAEGKIIGTILCGSYEDIAEKFRREYSDKNVVKSIVKGVEKVKAEKSKQEIFPLPLISGNNFIYSPECEYRYQEARDMVKNMTCNDGFSVEIRGADCIVSYRCEGDINIGGK